MIRIINIKLGLNEDIQELKKIIQKMLGVKELKQFHVRKKAIDARNKQKIHHVYAVDVEVDGEKSIVARLNNSDISIAPSNNYNLPVGKPLKKRPVIVGTGPAGLFCGLILAQCGYAPILLERGKCVEERKKDVDEFWKNAKLSPDSNVQFGEGGAGTFSDGKLTTGIKNIRIQKVLEEFFKHGASPEILYLSKPHIGTDKLCEIVANIRKEIIRLGGEVRFEHKLVNLNIENQSICGAVIKPKDSDEYVIDTDTVVLAIGHSARDTYELLRDCGVQMEQKPFSIGVRIEHQQLEIDKTQYASFHNQLPSADYKLAVHLPNGRSAYTFCQCPGGVVVNASSEFGHLVTNGMSFFARDGINSNSALLVGVNPSDFGSDDPLAGIKMQREIEKRAFEQGGGNYNAPAQLVGDFLNRKASTSYGTITPTFLPNVLMGDIRNVLPEFITDTIHEALLLMDKRFRGFATHDAVLTAPETRSSSPVRFIRNRETMNITFKGLYSAGEGGGHAGGITSAAVDGIRCAEICMI